MVVVILVVLLVAILLVLVAVSKGRVAGIYKQNSSGLTVKPKEGELTTYYTIKILNSPMGINPD